jgi:hypothetical protein
MLALTGRDRRALGTQREVVLGDQLRRFQKHMQNAALVGDEGSRRMLFLNPKESEDVHSVAHTFSFGVPPNQNLRLNSDQIGNVCILYNANVNRLKELML